MGVFAYEARSQSGNLISGVINAGSIDEAGQRLSEQNIFVVRLGPTKEGGVAAVRAKHAGGPRVKRQSVIWFTSQLSVMIETGINISEALDCLARQTKDEAFHGVLEEVAKHVSEGKALSDAIANHPRAFPDIMPALIHAGEMSGTMSLMLTRLGSYLRNQAAVVRRLRAAMTYPLFMLLFSVGVTVFMLTVILPRFAKIFADKGAALPTPTRVLMALSRGLLDYSYVWIMAGIVAVIGGYLWSQTAGGRRGIDWLKVNTPIVRGIYRRYALARAFRTLGTVIEAGVPLTDSLQIAQDVSDNAYYRELWGQVSARVIRGERLAGPLLNSQYVDESIAQMVDSGDKSGKLGVVLGILAEFTEEEFDQTVKTSMQFIEPAMIVFVGGLIGFIAVSLLLPMFSLARVVAN